MTQEAHTSIGENGTEEEAMPISIEVIVEAEKVAGMAFTEKERQLMLKGMNERLTKYQQIRTVPLDNSVAPVISFSLEVSGKEPSDPGEPRPFNISQTPMITLPDDLEELAFYPVTHLAQLIQSRQISSVNLTKMYLNRLKRYDPQLQCVVTLTEKHALAQAKRADEEIANGRYRGPLHGIPWGAKDLLATQDIPTTWGAMPFKEQMIDMNATVVERLDQAGAVMVAKLTLGALAWGDVWFGGKTKNPWNLEEGSSGSSAGSASAVAAGLVGFAIGTETYGSIVSPSHRCGVTGLRPTFGRVSRHGAMALSWTMDKIGPISRSVEDCALVFNSIHGTDGMDITAVNEPFHWNPNEVDLTALRIGYVKSAFDKDRENKQHDDESLSLLRSLGANLIPIALPDYPISALSIILWAEAAAAFDELTRSDQDDLLVRQEREAWPNVLREARLIPAVEYIQANRIRRLLLQEMAELMAGVDLYIAPSFENDNLLLTNLTGHPAVVVPNGFSEDEIPQSSITFIGPFFDEATLLAVARVYQQNSDFHLKHPNMQLLS